MAVLLFGTGDDITRKGCPGRQERRIGSGHRCGKPPAAGEEDARAGAGPRKLQTTPSRRKATRDTQEAAAGTLANIEIITSAADRITDTLPGKCYSRKLGNVLRIAVALTPSYALFAGHEVGVENWAMLASLIATAR